MKQIILDIEELSEIRELYTRTPPKVIIGMIKVISILAMLLLAGVVCVLVGV